ncbi:MAG: hypothetical protein ACWGMZ_11305, partial [Thermoguttaceae bacterium]
MLERINQLETETQALRSELQAVKQDVVRLPSTETISQPEFMKTVSNYSATMDPTAMQAAPEEDYYTLDEIKAEMKKLSWKKGNFSITPYGYLWAATTYETERSFNGDYTYYVYSPQSSSQVGPTYHIDAKSTLFGFDILGPRIPGLDWAQSGGKVEFDFQGAS